MIIGLTGQSGAGKSTVSRALSLQEGFYVIDCDKIARQVTEDGSLCNAEIKKHFPEAVSQKLVLDRRIMAQIVFSDNAKLREYEAVIYPYITHVVNECISVLCSYGYEVIILDAPTLFEAGMDRICDKIISVTADKAKRAERIKQRDGISDEMIEKRFSSQKDEAFFRQNCDYILCNDSDIAELYRQTESMIKEIRTIING